MYESTESNVLQRSFIMNPLEKSQLFQVALHEHSFRNHRFKPRCSLYFGSILINAQFVDNS